MRSTARLDYEGAQRPIDDGTRRRVAAAAAPRSGRLRLAARGRPRRRLAAAARAGGRRLRRRAGTLEFRTLLPGRGVERPDLAAHRLRRRVAHGLRPGRPAADAAAAGPARRPAPAPHRARAGHRLAGRAALPRLHPLARPRAGPNHAAMVTPAPGCCAAAGTSASTARCPPSRSTRRWPRSTPTSPRRCAGSATGTPARSAWPCARAPTVPDWVLDRLHELPEVLQESGAGARTGTSARSSTWSRRACCSDRVGEKFDAVVVDVDEKDPSRGVVTHPGAGRRGAGSRATGRCRSAPTSGCGSPPPTSPPARCPSSSPEPSGRRCAAVPAEWAQMCGRTTPSRRRWAARRALGANGPACRPGSVPVTAKVTGGDHPSTTAVADSLQRSTRALGRVTLGRARTAPGGAAS